MMLSTLSFFVAFLGVTSKAIDAEFNPYPEKPLLRPGNIYEGIFAPANTGEDDNADLVKQLFTIGDDDDADNKFSSEKEVIPIGESEQLEDHNMEKRLYISRQGFRPAKRSMAIGRAGMRPGKRAFASSYRHGKTSQRFPESYFPFDRFYYFDE